MVLIRVETICLFYSDNSSPSWHKLSDSYLIRILEQKSFIFAPIHSNYYKPHKTVRKLLSLILICMLSFTAFGQQIPNGSFKYWGSSYTPDGWGTWASAIAPYNNTSALSLSKLASKDTAALDYPQDSATLKLTVDTVTLPSQGLITLAGFASLGGSGYTGPPNGSGLTFGYLSYTAKPDTLYFDYKYTTPAADDTAAIIMILTGFDSTSNMHTTYLVQTWLLPLASQWRRNNAISLINLYNPALHGHPDSLQLIFYSSVSSSPHIGTTLWIDSLHFDASVNPPTVGISASNDFENTVYAYPNPSYGRLEIDIPIRCRGSKVKLVDTEGREAYSGYLTDTHNLISTSGLSSGTYSLLIYSTDGLTRYRGRISIVNN